MSSRGNGGGPHSAGGNNFGSSLSGGHGLDEQQKYMLDIHLFKGTVYVFMEFVSHFIQLVTSSCSVCSHNNSCCSSQHSSSQHAMPAHSHDYKLKLYTQ